MSKDIATKEEVTQLLRKAKSGSKDAYNQLYPLVYEHLKLIARHQLSAERKNHTLNNTELVHESYLKLINQTEIEWQDRQHFFNVAARAMRQILIDYARKQLAGKRGGKVQNITLDENLINVEKEAGDVIELDELLKELEKLNERLARIVELRYFAGLSIEHTAEVLNISTSTVNRDWLKARSWLHQHIRKK